MFVGIRISALYLQDKIIIVNNEGKNYVYKRIDLFTSDLEYKLRKYRVSRYPYELFIKEDKFIVNRRGLNGLHSKNRL